MDDLQIVLNRAMRLIVRKRVVDRVRIEELCERTGILSVNRMTAEEHLRIIWTAKLDQNSPLSEWFRAISNSSTRASSRGDIFTSAITSLATRNVPHTAITTWNFTDESLRNPQSLQMAKTQARHFIKNLPL